MSPLNGMVETAIYEKKALSLVWAEHMAGTRQLLIQPLSPLVSLDELRKDSIYEVHNFFEIINFSGFIGPDTILQYAQFEDYLKRTDFDSRLPNEEDMNAAKKLLDCFISYASKEISDNN